MSRLLLALYLLEAGLLLVLAPWSRFWDRNYFSAYFPALGEMLGHPYVKGAVTGIGLVSLAAALMELGLIVWHRVAAAQADHGA